MASPWGVFFYPPVADPNLLPFPSSHYPPLSLNQNQIRELESRFAVLFCPSICCFSLFILFAKIPQLNVLVISQKFDICSNFFTKPDPFDIVVLNNV